MNFIRAFAEHRIAPNLLMLTMLLSGLFVLNRFEVRFFPGFEIQTATVNASWRGASAEDVGNALLPPLENELRDIADLKKMSSNARDGGGFITLEFPESVDMISVTNEIRRRLELALTKLPADSERPEVRAGEQRDDVMRLSLSGNSIAELQKLARRLENELLQLGVVRVDVSGLPDNEIQIYLSQRRLTELQLTPRQIGQQLARQNIDTTAGNIGDTRNKRLLRVVSKRKALINFDSMSIVDGGGNVVRLGDIANIRRVPRANAVELFFNSKPAVEFRLSRKSGGNILHTADRVHAWLAEIRAELPAGVALTAHRERWIAIQSRTELLVENGFQGLAVVLLFLLLFLRGRLAFWIAAGIPATFMVALATLYVSGGTINMISLFAFIMVTGIVVDDAIVVGENSMYYLQKGHTPLEAAVEGAREMFPAVFSSTFTTIASFIPLLIVGGVIGSIMFAIPLVVICVLTASLFECFFVLPGHLRGAFISIAKSPPTRWRLWVDETFERFQEGPFRRSIQLALRFRWVTITVAFVCLTLTFALLIGGFLKYRFFPGAELNVVRAQITFIAGTSRTTVETFMHDMTQSVRNAEKDFPDEQNLVRNLSTILGDDGDEQARLWVELAQPEERNVGTRDFVRAWRKHLPTHASLERLILRESHGGPGGEDLEIRLGGDDYDALKTAALALQTALTDIPGVTRPSDDMPFGKRQTVFELTSQGRALNLTVEDIGRQLRDAFDGYRVQTLYEGVDETEVRVLTTPDGDLSAFRLRLPNGSDVALGEVAVLHERQGFDSIQRVNTQPIINVVGDVDFKVTTADEVIAQLQQSILPDLAARYGVSYSFEGSRANERETVGDMKTGLVIALLSIFVILAAVFASWTLPFAILLTVPFGVIGAMIGHWLLGYELSILSAFGVFALNGIVINDSIILVREYLQRRKKSPHADNDNLITDAVCRRLRAIFLTSLTTVGGLIPLLFERSTQAQFLIPMAISISFGLAFATLLILYLMPAFLSVHHAIGAFLIKYNPLHHPLTKKI